MNRLFLVVFALPICLHAVKYPVVNYQTSDGLPQNHINALIQDQLGYIFIGTQSGIGKFDGKRFQVITRKDGLPNNFINDFAMDNQGNIWAATQEGLAKIDNNNQISSYLASEFIQALFNDKTTNTLWVLTRGGVYYLKEENFIRYTLLDFQLKKNKENIPNGLIITNLGVKYFSSPSEILEIKKDKIRVIKSDNAINFLKWLDKTVMVGTEQGLFYLQGDRIRPYVDFSMGNINHPVTDVVFDESGAAWVGTPTGLHYYSSPSESPLVISDENGLAAHGIRRILIDREKNVFVGTEWGLSQLSPYLFKMYDESDGLPHKFVWDFEEDNGTLLVSCDHGIAELNTTSGEITPISLVNQELKDYSIRTIIKFRENQFLLGTRENGIYQWNRSDQLVKIHERANVLSAVRSQDEADRPITWFGTSNGLLKYDGKNFQRIHEGLKNKNIWAVDVYDKDTLLVGTGKGIQKCYREKFVTSVLENKINKDTLVNDIKVISPAEILVATELNGLYIYKDNQLKQLTTSDGLAHNDIWAVIKDDRGNIWMNTTVSLDRYTNGFVSHFNRKTGLFGEEGGIHAVYKASSGKIYFGITPGFIEIPVQKTRVDTNINTPILYIKEIKIMGKKVPFNPPQSFDLQLKYGNNNIAFEYIAVSNRKENPVFYRTRLIPLDDQWSEPTKQTHIKYLNLEPGLYTFQVTANNGGGETRWLESKNHVNVLILRPFWLTWWFLLLVSLLVMLLAFFIIKIRLNTLHRQKQILEKQVQERTEELKYLSITDPLTDLKNRRYLEEKIKEDIGLIERHIYDNLKSEKVTKTPILGVFILDIDHFKEVNDHYGHKAGDIVIVDIAKVLIDMLRHSDTIVRWGGEEFLIITWQKEKSNSFELAERIRKKIASFKFKIDENTTIQRTVSVGFAHFPFIPNNTRQVTWPHVVSLADSALYIAKNNGRDLSVGIECGKNIKRITESDMNFKEVVSNIKMGTKKRILKLVSHQDNLTISQHKI
ncbi:MAG: diguanylate cyclase [Candidatus Aminicenantes bacterium]